MLRETFRQCLPGTQTPAPEWRATLQHVARCTRLHKLIIPSVTAAELGLLAPALQQLRTLRLNHAAPVAADGDAVVEVLLGLPHLTKLQWDNPAMHTLQRWYNGRPCRWEDLFYPAVCVSHLARLPLHSLKQPVRWWDLVVRGSTPVEEVRAAAANVTRRCPAGFRWAKSQGKPPSLSFPSWGGGVAADVAGVLRALQPLFASLTWFILSGVEWRVEQVKVLGEVLPRTCTRLGLTYGSTTRAALLQVVRSLPWVERLQLADQEMVPEDVVAYARLARRLKREDGGGAAEVRLEEVVVERPSRLVSVSEAEHKRQWRQAARAVREAGSVAIKLVW